MNTGALVDNHYSKALTAVDPYALHAYIKQQFAGATSRPTVDQWTQQAIAFGLSSADAARVANAWYAYAQPGADTSDAGFATVFRGIAGQAGGTAQGTPYAPPSQSVSMGTSVPTTVPSQSVSLGSGSFTPATSLVGTGSFTPAPISTGGFTPAAQMPGQQPTTTPVTTTPVAPAPQPAATPPVSAPIAVGGFTPVGQMPGQQPTVTPVAQPVAPTTPAPGTQAPPSPPPPTPTAATDPGSVPPLVRWNTYNDYLLNWQNRNRDAYMAGRPFSEQMLNEDQWRQARANLGMPVPDMPPAPQSSGGTEPPPLMRWGEYGEYAANYWNRYKDAYVSGKPFNEQLLDQSSWARIRTNLGLSVPQSPAAPARAPLTPPEWEHWNQYGEYVANWQNRRADAMREGRRLEMEEPLLSEAQYHQNRASIGLAVPRVPSAQEQAFTAYAQTPTYRAMQGLGGTIPPFGVPQEAAQQAQEGGFFRSPWAAPSNTQDSLLSNNPSNLPGLPPVARPEQLNYRAWNNSKPTQQQAHLSLTSAHGYDDNDYLSQFERALPTPGKGKSGFWARRI